MKKTIIGAIVGGIIIFLWQFLSWGVLNLHEAQQKYTPKQDSILAYLGTQFTEDGAYLMPTFAPGTSRDEMGSR
jgi:TM2 domain-containing membrane protein YozV